TPDLTRLDQIRAGHFLQMKGQRRVGESEPVGNFAGGESFRALFDQKPEDRKTRFLRQAGQCRQYRFKFHVSSIMEIILEVNPAQRHQRSWWLENREGAVRVNASRSARFPPSHGQFPGAPPAANALSQASAFDRA